MVRHVDYKLVRRALLRDLKAGVIDQKDVCDAHPDLMRAARYVGKPSDQVCPVCEKTNLQLVSYVYGDTLKTANGRCISQPGELDQLDESYDEFACYVIEVCTQCGWNHLDRRYLMGKRWAG